MKLLAIRKCDACGKEKDIYKGKICANGHFICERCSAGKWTCPLCGKKLK